MYDFTPSEEQQMLIEVARRFAESDVRPVARDAEEGDGLSQELIEKGWELGILQASVPEEYGGFGEYSALTGILALEELAWGDMAATMAVMTPGLFAMPILLAGSEDQKQAYLPPLLEAEWQPYTAALIEPHFDFDPGDLRTTAVREGDTWVLNGKKIYVPFADRAEAFIVYAAVDGQTQGFIVPAELTGITVGEPHKLLGINALPNFSVTFKNVHVPLGNRLGGEEGHDFTPVITSAQLAMAAIALGVSRAAFEYARDYAKEREAFGVKIAQKQTIAFMLAEMAAEIEAIRLLVWEAAWMVDTKHPQAFKQAYLAHTGASDMAMMVTDRAVQILGGHGYIREYPVEMWMRNGRGIANLLGMAMI